LRVFDHFNLIAPLYDRAIPLQNIEHLISLLDISPGGSLLDAGGGTGRVSKVLTEYYSCVCVADLSEMMLKQALSKGGLCTVQSHTEYLPFLEETFDNIIMVDALHHVCDHEMTARELWRVIKAGGRIVIEEPDIRRVGVKLIAIAEKIALMRSHFINPLRIAKLFSETYASSKIYTDGANSWVVIDKPRFVPERGL
jgi:demethylmenaquinone methyltransferase/2-methoxy-6-polyprenyl-1,4-benzoquinol methylase